MTDQIPTARSTLQAEYVCVLVWCRSCHHQAPADPQAIVAAGRGDVPLRDLRFGCTRCGSSRRTDRVITARDALRDWKRLLSQ
jgi:hypothetical protein